MAQVAKRAPIPAVTVPSPAGEADLAVLQRELAEQRECRTRLENELAALRAHCAPMQSEIEAIRRVRAMFECELDGRIRFANDNLLQILGYRSDEVVGKPHAMLVDESQREAEAYRETWRRVRAGDFQAGQMLYVCKHGRQVWMQGYLSPTFDADGRPVGVVSYNTDVTAQVRETQVLRATVEQIQEAVSAALNGDLSHRIGSDGQNGQVESLCRAMNALFEAIATVVNDVNRSVDAARNRDLCVRIDMTGKKGVFGELAGGVNTLIDDTVSLLRQIRTAAAEVRSGADEISKGNIHLSQRTETQATNLEETASSMAQMTNSVKATADNAGQARALSVAAREQAEKGGKVVENAIAAMRGINTSSKRIADIIGVIDAIAFQTNLLALNAAVEAARAGDQGRGFAVVASEVRNLAGRSASAAKEIKALIKESVVRVEEGSRLVDESGMALGDIGAAVERVSDVIAEIARASCEQASGIEHVNQAVIEMDEMTQQNAALVEQAAAVSEAILDEATRLAEAVARYRIGEEPSVDPSVNGGRYRD